MTKKQLESARMVISRTCNRKVKLIIRVNTFFPVTKKSLGVRMGGGKGAIDHEVAVVKAGHVLFEVDNVSKELAIEALSKAAYKLNIKCKIVCRKFVHLND